MFELVANCPEAEPIFTVAAGNLGQDQKQADQIGGYDRNGKETGTCCQASRRGPQLGLQDAGHVGALTEQL
jgi:hypothetical protein